MGIVGQVFLSLGMIVSVFVLARLRYRDGKDKGWDEAWVVCSEIVLRHHKRADEKIHTPESLSLDIYLEVMSLSLLDKKDRKDLRVLHIPKKEN